MKIGYVTLLANYSDPTRTPRYAEVRDLTLHAEDAGFDSVWLYDQLVYRYPDKPEIGIWECWTTLAALAEAARRIEIGTLVTCAAFRNPALLAKMVVTVDEISGGRLILGLGAGWNEPEFAAFGLPFDHRVDRFEEALQIIVPLLREGHMTYQGAYHTARDCTMNPRGPRAGGPPLLIGAHGPRMIKLTARFADLWNTDFVTSPSELIAPRVSLLSECAAIGRDPASVRLSATAHVAYPEIAPAPLGLDSCITGAAEEVALVLKSFADAGVAHLMCHCEPNTPAALSRLADAIHLYRQQ